jgi:hypothetical protein
MVAFAGALCGVGGYNVVGVGGLLRRGLLFLQGKKGGRKPGLL